MATPALNAAFTLTATITTPATTSATGTVNFRNAANASLTNCAAVALTGTGTTKTATCSVTETSAGTKTYSALYSGDTNFNAGTNPTTSVTLTAPDVATKTTVTTSATTLDYPNAPTLTATVAATANTVTGGTVTFKRLNIDVPGCVNLPLTTAGANKIATCSPVSTSLPVGLHTFTALYGGVAGFAASSGSSPTININEPPPANNNVGNNSEANPVLIDAFYVHPDHLGTPRVVTRPLDNKRVWEWQSTPFGESAANENPQNVTGAAQATNEFRYNLRFPGQFADAESGKHYNYFRDYDASTGRYVESDPIGLEGGINTFSYVYGNPTDNIDFFGLACTPRQRVFMQLAVQIACKWGGPRSCSPADSCEVNKEKISKNSACAAARRAINQKCFAGGDAGHKQAEAEAINAVKRCQEMSVKCC